MMIIDANNFCVDGYCVFMTRSLLKYYFALQECTVCAANDKPDEDGQNGFIGTHCCEKRPTRRDFQSFDSADKFS